MNGVSTFKRLYRQPYRPVIARDLFAECGIAQIEAAEKIGLNKETLRLMLNRGYKPVYKAWAVQKIEQYIKTLTVAIAWLRLNGLTLKDLWKPSADKTFHKYPSDHGERLYHSRRNNLPARARASRAIQQFNIQNSRRKRLMENGFVTLAAFGHKKDPFESVRIRTGDGDILKRIFQMAVDSNGMFSVIAPWGAGKTTAIEMATKDIDAYLLKIISADKERIGIHDIERMIVKQLFPSEPIARSREVRAHQVRRIMGEAAKEKPLILILEESHCMHTNTLRALKRIREYEWMGKKPLLSVILIGQFDKLKTGNLEEVRLRTDTYRLKGLAPSEASRYINETVGDHFEEDAIKAISELPVAKNFLELQESLIALMQAALRNGSKKVSALDVFSIYCGGIKQLIEKYDIKQSTLCEATGLDKTTLSLIINNKPHTLPKETENNAREAINAALKNLIPHGKTAPAIHPPASPLSKGGIKEGSRRGVSGGE